MNRRGFLKALGAAALGAALGAQRCLTLAAPTPAPVRDPALHEYAENVMRLMADAIQRIERSPGRPVFHVSREDWDRLVAFRGDDVALVRPVAELGHAAFSYT